MNRNEYNFTACKSPSIVRNLALVCSMEIDSMAGDFTFELKIHQLLQTMQRSLTLKHMVQSRHKNLRPIRKWNTSDRHFQIIFGPSQLAACISYPGHTAYPGPLGTKRNERVYVALLQHFPAWSTSLRSSFLNSLFSTRWSMGLTLEYATIMQ